MTYKNKKRKIIGNNGGLAPIFAILLLLGALFLLGYIFGEGEEGTRYEPDETCDKIFENGVHLIMYYDAQNTSFIGTIENTLQETLENVRVEVHLSTGEELGPTTPIDLSPGEITDVILETTSTNFEWWSVHPEVG